ncbi:MAG TPA: MarR family transcriptional regulator [Defluviitaleaceae bacterium]|nr:MarR family transcriptional regulator [Defluviitaleaceae bacterium]HPT76316.1 MarR family transcriptional regulator [Defluviitaleaceae bacterium]
MQDLLMDYLTQIISNISQAQSEVLKEKQLKYKISPNELRIIEIVGTSRKPKMMKDIAELMSMTKGGMTFLIDKLEKKGVVRRRQNDFDRRVLYIELTEEGEKIFEDYNRNKYAILYKWVENMNASTKKIMTEEFHRALQLAEKSV